jgi:acetylornithine deacetylase
MVEAHQNNAEYQATRDLMSLMIETSQRPGEGNVGFVDTVGAYLEDKGANVRKVDDPDFSDRSLLVVEIGAEDGEQALAAISHSDVVGVEGQTWDYDPWKLTEQGDLWLGRGVCDTHGSGVGMIMAGLRPKVAERLKQAGKRVSIVFTSDEEAAEAEWSYRGAKLAAGLLGVKPTITSKYFVAGEPTETTQGMTAMRAHKGRWLSHFLITVDRPGHSAESVQNAFSIGAEIVHEIGVFAADYLKSDDDGKGLKDIFSPPFSTAQVTAAQVKSGDYSITPDHVRFTVDLRTLPIVHGHQVAALKSLIENSSQITEGVSIDLENLDDFKGTVTEATSPIVIAAEAATGLSSLGFNGGDEGEVLRRAGKQGITLGPGELSFAHAPNEQIPIRSVLKSIDVYSDLFLRTSKLTQE